MDESVLDEFSTRRITQIGILRPEEEAWHDKKDIETSYRYAKEVWRKDKAMQKEDDRPYWQKDRFARPPGGPSPTFWNHSRVLKWMVDADLPDPLQDFVR